MLFDGKACSVRIIAPYTSHRPIRVKSAQDGYSVTDFLHERMPYRTKSFWEERISSGLISRKGKLLNANDRLTVGEELVHTVPAQIEPSVPDAIPILYEDESVLVVNKPAPLPIHAGGRYNRNCLVAMLEERFSQKLYVVHRLDSVTEGIVVLAKNPQISASWGKAFQEKKITKRYMALCKFEKGCPPEGHSWRCDLAIGRYKSFVFCCDKNAQNPKLATTLFTLATKIDDLFGLVSCNPISGRTHQIRLHCEAMGHSIVGDAIYNGSALSNKVQKRQNWAIALQNQHIKNEKNGAAFSLKTPDHWFQAKALDELFQEENSAIA